MQITKLRTNHLDRPLGFGFDKAILSWLTTDTLAARQAVSRVEVSLTADESSTMYDSGRVKTVYAPDSLRIVSGMDSAGWTLPLTLQPMTRWRMCSGRTTPCGPWQACPGATATRCSPG